MPSVDNHAPRAVDTIQQGALSFVQEFLPEGVPNEHALFVDWNATHIFTPTSEQLANCLVRYTTLLRMIESTDALRIIDMFVMGASELTLAYLGRSEAGGRTIPADTLHASSTTAHRLSTRLDEFMGGYFRDYDGVRRLRAIADTLQAIAPDLA